MYFLIFLIVMDSLGYIGEQIPVSGTGSMYPTFPKGQKKDPKDQSKEVAARPIMLPYPNGLFLFNQRYFGYQLKRGDIIDFENKKTREITKSLNGVETGMVKRIIGMPGDTIEIRDGMVLINNLPLVEPYTALSRSTFGGTFIHNCNKLKIPENKIFVLGDNRKGSGDSRYDLGLIDLKDIRHVLPYDMQIGVYDKNWREIQNDLKESAKIKLNIEKYLELLNKKRRENGVKLLKLEPKLTESAFNRGKIMLDYNDYSFEATKSGYTMKKSMQEADYDNIVWAEAPIIGYYEAEELIENQFEFPEHKKFLLNRDYEDFGLAEVEGVVNGCPTQVIVQQFAGYIPPNYKKEDIEKIEKLNAKLAEIQSGWKKLKDYKDFYEKNYKDIDRINEIIDTRINNLKKILQKMESNLWLSREEEDYLNNQDLKLNEEQNALAKKINGS